MKRIFRDLWIHMVFIVLAMVIIFKFSSAPVWFEFCENWLLRPHEETTAYVDY